MHVELLSAFLQLLLLLWQLLVLVLLLLRLPLPLLLLQNVVLTHYLSYLLRKPPQPLGFWSALPIAHLQYGVLVRGAW